MRYQIVSIELSTGDVWTDGVLYRSLAKVKRIILTANVMDADYLYQWEAIKV